MPKYKFLTSGGTHGAVTNKDYKYVKGDVIEAPEKEFAHLPKSEYEVVRDPKSGETAKEPSAGDTRMADGSPTTIAPGRGK